MPATPGRRPRLRGRIVAAIGILVLTGAAAAAVVAITNQRNESTYFDFQSEQGFTGPTAARVWVGVAQVKVAAGDLVRFEGVTVTPGDALVQALVAPLRETDASLGYVTEDELTQADKAPYAPLAGATFTDADGALGIVLVIDASSERLVRNMVISFRVNGGAIQHQTIPSAIRVCAEPASCPPPLEGAP